MNDQDALLADQRKDVQACRVQDMAGSLQSLCWGSAALGGVMSAYFSGSLVDAWGPRGVFAATAVFPLIVSVAALLISEKPTSLVPGGKPSFSRDIAAQPISAQLHAWDNHLGCFVHLPCVMTLNHVEQLKATDIKFLLISNVRSPFLR